MAVPALSVRSRRPISTPWMATGVGSSSSTCRNHSQIAEIAERLFFGVSAKIELVPVMTADDLRKGLSGVQATIQRYG